MKRVLIITYYWPPAGGPGVQRVLKFARYLPEYGWDPLILSVRNGEYPARDETLQKEVPAELPVFLARARDPFTLYKNGPGKTARLSRSRYWHKTSPACVTLWRLLYA